MNFSCCQLTPEGLEILLGKELLSLTTLSIRDNNLRKAAGYVIAKLFGSKGKIRVFDVQNNSLGDVGVSSIAGGFSSELNDMKLRIPSSSSSSISPSLMLSKLSLYELDLSGNDIGDVGVVALCSGLKSFVKNAHKVGRLLSLKILRLNRNRITDKGASSLAQLINLGNLPRSDTETGEGDSICSNTKVACKSVESSLPLLLEELGLSDNCIGSHGVNIILLAATRAPVSPDNMEEKYCLPNNWSTFMDNRNNIDKTNVPTDLSLANPEGFDNMTIGLCPKTHTTSNFQNMYHIPQGIILRKLDFSRCQLTIESLEILTAYLFSHTESNTPLSSSFSPSPSNCGLIDEKDIPLKVLIQIDFHFSERDSDNVLQMMTSSCERLGITISDENNLLDPVILLFGFKYLFARFFLFST